MVCIFNCLMVNVESAARLSINDKCFFGVGCPQENQSITRDKRAIFDVRFIAQKFLKYNTYPGRV